ncbi:MAG: 50S ribosomal protein L10 [Chloroflexi bacterium]|nr:50S ribosomal protein L10 [Chloroflexota bacterium]
MPTEAKRETVAELVEVFSTHPTSIVADYRGLKVSELGAIRRSLHDKGIQYRVVKNRLAKIAAEQAGISEMTPLLEGPTGIALGSGDEAAVAKSFLEAVRPFRTVAVRGGVLRGRRIEASDVTKLSTLPAREVLLGQLAGGFASPLSTMAGLLSAPLRNLGYALQQVADRKAAAAEGQG